MERQKIKKRIEYLNLKFSNGGIGGYVNELDKIKRIVSSNGFKFETDEEFEIALGAYFDEKNSDNISRLDGISKSLKTIASCVKFIAIIIGLSVVGSLILFLLKFV